MKILSRVQKGISALTNFIFLNIMYVTGIGVTSLFSKLVGKRFLDTDNYKSTWETPTGSKNLDSMY